MSEMIAIWRVQLRETLETSIVFDHADVVARSASEAAKKGKTDGLVVTKVELLGAAAR